MLASALIPIYQSHTPDFFLHRCILLTKPQNRTRGNRETSKKNTRTRSVSCKIFLVSSTADTPTSATGFGIKPGEKLLDSPSVAQFPDSDVLASMLQSCSHAKQVRSVHRIVLTSLRTSETFVYNNLICAYVRFGELRDARKVFDRMVHRNTVTWTAMLGGYVKFGLDEEFYGLLNHLVRGCIELNGSTFVCILNQCGRLLDGKLGEQIHARVVKGKWNNLIVNSALVHFYSQCGDITGAFKIFNRMSERDVICWTTMITGCAQQGFGNVFSMFTRMQNDGFCPNEFTVCSCLKACGEEKALNIGRQLHGAIVKKMVRYDVFVGSCLVSMYMKCGKVRSARTFFDRMAKRNTVTWTSMIAGYAQNELGEEAISLFRKMKRRRIVANKLTIVSILSAFGLVGCLCLGKEVHAQILKNKMEKNIYIGSTLVWFYCKFGKHGYARNVLQSMPMRDVFSWTAFISGHARFGNGFRALESLTHMLWEGVEPNPFTYSSALKACTRVEAVREGRWLHASANKASALSNVYVGSALIDLYAKCGCVEDAFRVFNTMTERNIVSWKAMIIGYARIGMCKEALKLMYRMQAEGIKVDELTIATVLGACGDIQWDVGSSAVYNIESR